MTAHLVHHACALPDQRGRSLSLWDCQELARQVVSEGVVASISAETVRRRLAGHGLKPWRFHYWLTTQQPRDAAFAAIVEELCALYTRPLAPGEVVLCVDEKTSIQPRPRAHPTRSPRAKTPAAVEHEYRRDGALHLFAAFDTRTGHVYGQGHRRKRAAEFVAFLRFLDEHLDAAARVHLVLDNLRTHKTKAVQAWLAEHPRFVLHFTPVHCSWLNQVDQWFAFLTRKRLRVADFAALDDLHLKLRRFVSEWNTQAHPFRWTERSFAKILAKCAAATAAGNPVTPTTPTQDVPFTA
ncbi:MAG: IS630 family transposase [Thermocrispum sp.]